MFFGVEGLNFFGRWDFFEIYGGSGWRFFWGLIIFERIYNKLLKKVSFLLDLHQLLILNQVIN